MRRLCKNDIWLEKVGDGLARVEVDQERRARISVSRHGEVCLGTCACEPRGELDYRSEPVADPKEYWLQD